MHALRAMIHIAAQDTAHPVRGEDVARRESLPQPFLSKILKILVSKGLLNSVRGPGGGFRLARASKDISLYDIVEAIEGPSYFAECALGWRECRDENPCPLHQEWKTMRGHLADSLKATSLAELVRREALRANAAETPAATPA